MSSRARLTIIANYLEVLERPLRMKEIYTDCIINACSPLAMVGKYDEYFEKYEKDSNTSMPTLLNIRKNLSAMLSRDTKTFNQNYNLQPYARNVRYKNETDYIVIMNTSFGYEHFVNGETVYSDTYPQNEFIRGIKDNGAFFKQSFPFENHFNWKYFYDKFISAVLKEYDSSHIILIKVNSAQWYMDTQKICSFGDKSAKFRSRIEEIDDYFLEKTHCLSIDEQFNFIPVKKEACAFTYSSKSSVFYQRLVSDIESIVDGKTDEFEYRGLNYFNPFVRHLIKKLSMDILKDNKNVLDEIENKMLTIDDIKNNCDNLANDFYRNIIRLYQFVDDNNNYTLSDFVIELLNESQHPDSRVDFELLELYVKYLKLNINDIIAIYMLYSHCENKNAFRDVVKNMIENNNCLPVKAVRKMRAKNIHFLKDYPYIHSDLKNIKETESIYLRIENNVYLRINLSENDFIEKIDMKIGKNFDYKRIIEDGYICPIEYADALCASYAFYIDRAKHNESNCPVKIEFHDIDQYSDSLGIYDYTDILVNENFVITLAGKKVDVSKFKVICDFSFLLNKYVKICIICSGLSDQICYYIFGKKLEEEKIFGFFNSKYDVYYDDTFYLHNICFNGLEITKFKIQGGGISKKLISNLLSMKLKNQIGRNSKFPDILYKNGLDDTVIVSAEEKKLSEYKLCNKICSHIKADGNPYSMLRRKIDFYPCFYYTLVRPETFSLEKRCNWNDYLVFPEFDEINRRISEEMMLCDAVAIHMRLGDFVSVGYDVDNRFYIESINKLLAIPEYKNKKYYVFSDNVPYVKEHAGEFGLELLDSDKITYIDHNKGEDSFRDLQLMTYSKIMIASGSGVARMAYILSKRCEQIYLWKAEGLAFLKK